MAEDKARNRVPSCDSARARNAVFRPQGPAVARMDFFNGLFARERSRDTMLVDYLPIVILMAVAVGFAAVSLIITHLFGPRRPNPVKLSPYESGVPPVGDARLRFSVKFYVVAMLFIVFDIEVVFLFPWAVVFKDLLAQGSFVFTEMAVFLGVLVLGLAYVWRKGGLDWD